MEKQIRNMNNIITLLNFWFLLDCLFLFSVSDACTTRSNVSVGVVIDRSSRVGKEQRVAIELAVRDFNDSCRLNMVLHIEDSHGNAASAAFDLASHTKLNAIVGLITLEEAAFLSQFQTPTKNIPIISLSPPSTSIVSPQQQTSPKKTRFFFQISPPNSYRTQCIASIVSRFRWKKVILIHEQGRSTAFSEGSGIFSRLSDSLRAVDSSIDHHFPFPRLSSMLDPNSFVERELKTVKSKNVKILVLGESSLEFAVILFEKAKLLGMMEKGYVWIVSDEIANLLDSLDSSVLLNMQGVIGLKTDYDDTNEYFREFKSKFRAKYGLEYPPEEEKSNPGLYSLRAYDAMHTLFEAFRKFPEGKIYDPIELSDKISSSDFQGLSGGISFENGFLSHKPIFRIFNVIGRGYREMATWSPDFGFSEELSSIFWPGGKKTVPTGRSMGSEENPMRIGVPANGAFKQFVHVIVTTDENGRNQTRIFGFSIDVFKAAVKLLPYDFHYVLIPYYGSYDEMVAEVHNKSLDGAVGDTEIMAERYAYASFTQPYIESGLQMVVTVKPGLKDSKTLPLRPFTMNMWLMLAAMSMSTGAIIWLSEYSTGNDQFTNDSFVGIIGSIMWFSVTIMSFSQRQNIKNGASQLVLAAWICVVFVVGASFTAVLSTMMTVPRIQPSFQEIDYLRNTNAAVGCNGNSFIVRYLIDVLHFKRENVRKIDSIDQYPKAFESGEIKAAFFVAPHAKIFLAEYCRGYTVSGPSIKLGGFGFVFPKGSQLETDISEAILRVTQSGYVNKLEQNMLQLCNCTSTPSTSITSELDDIRLDSGPFSGMFVVLGGTMVIAFIFAGARLVRESLMMKRIFVGAFLALIELWTIFGSTFFGHEIVENHINLGNGEMLEPNMVVV
ncbi:hypothetical protein ABFS83_03G048300 [Erythranthe nasuta]